MKEITEVADLKSGRIDFKILDGLRGIAATYVLINHARGNLFIGGAKYAQIKPLALWSLKEKVYFSALQATSLGREFVILFFILSGFSIAFSLNRLPQIKDFYLRRMIRIYPPYLVALLWAFVVFVLLQYAAPAVLPPGSISVFNSPEGAIKNILYIDNGNLIPQFWSLKFEVIFYLLVPFFVMKKNWYFIASLIIAIIAFIMNWRDLSASSNIGQYILDYNIYFALGVFCFHYYKSIAPKFTISNRFVFAAVALFLFCLMVVFKFWVKYDQNKISLLIASLLSLVLLFNFLRHNIKNKVLMFLGNISYTIYITHYASLMLLAGILYKTGVISSMEIQNKFLWLAGIPFAIGMSYLFYLLIEKPTKDLLSRMRKKS